MCKRNTVVLSGLLALVTLVLTGFMGCSLTSGTSATGTLFNLPPTVVLSADVQRGVAPLTVLFSSSSSTDNGVIVKREWDFGDGGTSQEISPSHTFTSTNTYTVTLTLTDEQGASASKTTTIIVTERPVAIIKVDRTSAPSAPAIFNFDASASFAPDAEVGDELLYRWDFGDGSRELLSVVSHTYATAGTYRVKLTVTNTVGVTGTADTIIDVGIPRPTISFRSPSADVGNIVLSNNSPLWVHAIFDVEPGVPYTLRAGVDGDQDECDALTALYDPLTGTELRRLSGNGGKIHGAVFSPNGTRVLSGGEDGTALLFDVTSGDQLASYAGTGAALTSVAYAPDGASILLGYRDGSLVLRDVASGGIIRGFAGHPAAVNSVAFSANGSQIISGDNSGQAILWNTADGTIIFRLDHGGSPVYGVAFSPTDSQQVATGSADNFARLWSTVDGRVTQEFGPVFSGGVQIAGHTGPVTSVAFSPDGATLLTGSRDKTAKLWNIVTGAEVRTFSGHTAAVGAVNFSPNGTQIITGSEDGTAIIWTASTAARLWQLAPCISAISAVAFTADGKTVLTGVAAANSIQLDTDPSSGNDLDLTVPTALLLPASQVPIATEGSTYYLWCEVDTPRTVPSRTYSSVLINVIPAFAANLSNPSSIPTIPYRTIQDSVTGATQGLARVVVPASTTRQIFSLGAMETGDRLFLSLLTVPGYGETYTQEGLNPLSVPPTLGSTVYSGFSMMIVDSQAMLYAWYQAGRVLFSPNSKFLIGHASNNYYMVLDGTGGELVPSVSVRVQRSFADDSGPRTQYVYLAFGGGTNISVANSSLFDVAAFTISGRTPTSINTVKSAIIARTQTLLAPYNFVVSENAPSLTTDPRTTIYFDCAGELLYATVGGVPITKSDLDFWGLGNFTDPRNATLDGRAVIAVKAILDDPAGYGSLADAELGLTIANAVLHHIGLQVGLQETTQPTGAVDDVMTNDITEVDNAALQFGTTDLAPGPGLSQIGIQDAPQLLTELFGAR